MKRTDYKIISRGQSDLYVKVNLLHTRAYSKSSRDVLLALAKATNYTLNAHVPKHAVLSRYASKDRGDAKKALKEVVRMGLAAKHPTRKEMTYNLTRLGLILIRELESKKEILENMHIYTYT